MSNTNQILYNNALNHINLLFSDESVSKQECLNNLKALDEEIQILIDAITWDIKNE